MSPILVVGGAGYIGAHTCKALAVSGLEPVVFDDLSSGHADFVRWGPLVRGDMHDTARLIAVLEEYRPQAVIHFAARAYVRESILDPLGYYHANVGGTLSLLRAMAASGVTRRLVFSSTCAVFPDKGGAMVTEDTPCQPQSPYGHSKWMVEQVLADLAGQGAIEQVTLRYFNAAGADLEAEMGERHQPETHLIPLALAAARSGAPLAVLGRDHSTPDGTAIRDYVHVADLAQAHVLAVRHLLDGKGSDVFNLGSGRGTSILEILDGLAAQGVRVPTVWRPRAAGDVSHMVADPAKAWRVLGWSAPLSELQTILGSAINWHARS